ncbi:CLUMA_CG014607, isoform A [Clunio marinus]|uniref:CLUMA_CG014607, isoform A n=1 Tax=Clunio marinus TaxID=568069 RepID=A0A1J1ILW2_9DIPT|nr:CLUMA_CG014607, isoform A [Clunio marinus]
MLFPRNSHTMKVFHNQRNLQFYNLTIIFDQMIHQQVLDNKIDTSEGENKIKLCDNKQPNEILKAEKFGSFYQDLNFIF